MNFTEAVAEVVSTSKRPDKLVEIRRFVNQSIREASLGANLARDIVETSHAIDPTLYAQSLALSEFPRFRKMVWMRIAGSKCYIDPLDITAVSKNNQDFQNKFYVAGDLLIWQAKVLGAAIELGYFQYPVILTDAAPTHWLLDAQPYMIIDKALAKVFHDIGDEESAKRHEAAARIAYLSFTADQATAINRGR